MHHDSLCVTDAAWLPSPSPRSDIYCLSLCTCFHLRRQQSLSVLLCDYQANLDAEASLGFALGGGGSPSPSARPSGGFTGALERKLPLCCVTADTEADQPQDPLCSCCATTNFEVPRLIVESSEYNIMRDMQENEAAMAIVSGNKDIKIVIDRTEVLREHNYSVTMSQNSEFNIIEGDLIPSPTTYYIAQKYLGNGAYGMVIQCRNVTTAETVALKILQSLENIDCAQEEEVILQTMKKLHSDRFYIVRMYESFFYKEHYCLVFELLDMDLHEFKQISPGQHLQLKQISPILQQLATALDFLNSAGIIHADLKSDNIMLVDHVRQPLKVKVIDFGISFDDPEEMIGETLQTLWYSVKSCEDLMDICQDQSSEDGGHGDQVILQMSLNEVSSSSTASPAKDGSKVNAKSGNRPEDSQAKVRRSERLAAIRKITSGKTAPNRRKRMREREDSVGQNRFMGRKRIELVL
ncbi:unnamed protein product [Pleuronectes platessa]|uniref:Protein kinase domain-containing protein n=1 Tax=Pleuronectes platessa TaxID=8262 RepID=A0A9N7UUQ1_PLEPL|nr:unnamed protein product [Pleuronectes platessa]